MLRDLEFSIFGWLGFVGGGGGTEGGWRFGGRPWLRLPPNSSLAMAGWEGGARREKSQRGAWGERRRCRGSRWRPPFGSPATGDFSGGEQGQWGGRKGGAGGRAAVRMSPFWFLYCHLIFLFV